MVWSPFLDLRDQTTCRIFREMRNVRFHRIEIQGDLQGIPF
jgi:hypothetical protein